MIKRNAKTIALFVSILIWITFLRFVPTFDYDESLYRRTAELMKAAHNPWLLSWDGWPLFHKPPFFYWLIGISSFFFDSDPAHVSSFAARVPSFLCTIGILQMLAWGPGYIQQGLRSRNLTWNAPLLFIMALFPMLTSTSVVFEPLQTLLLMPALLVLTRFFVIEGHLKRGEWLILAISLFGATIVKGLNGIIVPTFAFSLHWLLNWRHTRRSPQLRQAFRFTAFAFLPACALIAITFIILDLKLGRAFTTEFLWVQHFQRSQVPMESHSGSFFYHPLVIFLGSGFLTPFLIFWSRRVRMDYRAFGFPLTYALAFIVVFGFSATKLPHYMWPVWPALALWGSFLIESNPSRKKINALEMFASIPLLLFAFFTFSFALAPHFILNRMPPTPMVKSIIEHFPTHSYFQVTSLLFAGFCCLYFLIQRRKMMVSVNKTAIAAALFTLFLSWGILPTAKKLMIDPYYEIAQSVRARNATPSDCIRSSGALSATLSIALGNELLHNRCEPGLMKFLIAPEWKERECSERGLQIVDRKSYMVLCEKRN